MTQTAGGLDREALVAGRYDTRQFRLTQRARFVFAGGRGMRVRQATEKRVVLPTGEVVKVEQSEAGHAVHIHEDHRLHAVARPDTYRMRLAEVREEHGPQVALSLAGLFERIVNRSLRRSS